MTALESLAGSPDRFQPSPFSHPSCPLQNPLGLSCCSWPLPLGARDGNGGSNTPLISSSMTLRPGLYAMGTCHEERCFQTPRWVCLGKTSQG